VSQAPNVSGLTVQLSATRHCAPCPMCPLCGRRSHRVQSAYGRTLHDLPWYGAALTLRLRVRRFVCGTPQCPRRIFAEQFPALASLEARGQPRASRQRCNRLAEHEAVKPDTSGRPSGHGREQQDDPRAHASQPAPL